APLWIWSRRQRRSLGGWMVRWTVHAEFDVVNGQVTEQVPCFDPGDNVNHKHHRYFAQSMKGASPSGTSGRVETDPIEEFLSNQIVEGDLQNWCLGVACHSIVPHRKALVAR